MLAQPDLKNIPLLFLFPAFGAYSSGDFQVFKNLPVFRIFSFHEKQKNPLFGRIIFLKRKYRIFILWRISENDFWIFIQFRRFTRTNFDIIFIWREKLLSSREIFLG